MKIAIINNRYGATSRGGAENVVDRQIEILRDAGHKVVVVTTRPYGSKLPKNEDGVYRVGGLSSLFTRLDRWPVPIRLLWHLAEALNIYKGWYLSLRLAFTGCNLVIGHNLTGVSLWLARFAVSANMRFVLVLHDIQYLHPSGLMFKGRENLISTLHARIYQNLMRTVFYNVSKVISPSQWLGKLYGEKKIFPQNTIVTLPNTFIHANEVVIKPTTSNQLLFAGQLEPHKGVRELVEAFISIPGDIKLVIMGNGTLKKTLSNRIAGDKRITLKDWNESDLPSLMSQSRFMIVPSLCYENQPMTILKAMAVGLPVMGSDFGGVAELLANGAGLTFDPLSRQSLVMSISRAMNLTNEELRGLCQIASARLVELQQQVYRTKFLQIINEPL